MVSVRMFLSSVGWVLGVLLCLSCTWPIIDSKPMRDPSEIDKETSCYGVKCSNGGECETNGGARTKCTCRSGFTGSNCETYIDNSCSVPCRNGGECKTLEDGKTTCICRQGFTGTYCEGIEYSEINEDSWNGGGEDSGYSSYSEGFEGSTILGIVFGAILVIGLKVAFWIWVVIRCNRSPRPGLLHTAHIVHALAT